MVHQPVRSAVLIAVALVLLLLPAAAVCSPPRPSVGLHSAIAGNPNGPESGAAPRAVGPGTEGVVPTAPTRTLDLLNNTSEPGDWIPVNALGAYGLAYESESGTLVVTDSRSSSVSVFLNTTLLSNFGTGPDPTAVAIDPFSNLSFVADTGSNSLTEVNLTERQVVGTVEVGQAPTSVAFDGSQGTVWVANSLSENVSIIEGGTGLFEHSINLPADPQSLVADEAGGSMVVTMPTVGEVGLIGLGNLTLFAVLHVGGTPTALAVDAQNNVTFIANPSTGAINLLSVNAVTHVATLLPNVTVGAPVSSIAYDPSTHWVTILSNATDRAVIMNGSSDLTLFTTPVPSGIVSILATGHNGSILMADPARNVVYSAEFDSATLITQFGGGLFYWGADWLTFDPSSGLLYATIWDQNRIAVLQPTNNSIVATLPIGEFVVGSTLDPAHGLLVVADGGGPNLNLINTTTNTELPNVTNPDASWLLDPLYDAQNGLLYVSDYILNTVFVYNWTGSTYTPYRTITVIGILSGEWSSTYLALDPSSQHLFLSEYGTNKVTVINATTFSVLANVTVGNAPGVPAYDPANGLVYVPATGTRNVTVLNGTTDAVVRTLNMGCDPVMALFDHQSQNIYVLCYDSYVEVIDSATDSVAYTIPTVPCNAIDIGSGPGLAIDDAAEELFTSNDEISQGCAASNELDLTEMRLPSFSVTLAATVAGASPDAVATEGPSGNVLVADPGTGRVYLVDPTASTILKTGPPETGLTSIAYDPATNDVLVVDTNYGGLAVLNGSTLAVQNAVTLSGMPDQILFDAESQSAILTFPSDDRVSILPIPGLTPSNVEVGSDPTVLALDSLKQTVVVACNGDGTLWAVDPTLATAHAEATFVGNATALSYSPADEELYLSAQSNPEVALFSGETYQQIGSAKLPNIAVASAQPSAEVYDSADQGLVVADSGGNVVDFLSSWTSPVTNLTAVGVGPDAVTVDVEGTIFVANAGSGTLTVVPPLPLATITGITVVPGTIRGSWQTITDLSAALRAGNTTVAPIATVHWTVKPTGLGYLNASSATLDVDFTFGPSVWANGTVCVAASNLGETYTSCSAVEEVPGPATATSIHISPTNATLFLNASVSFYISVFNATDDPLEGAIVIWALSPSSLGALIPTATYSVMFEAGSAIGTGTLCATATSGIGTVGACATVSVEAHPPQGSSPPPGLLHHASPSLPWWIYGVVLIAAATALGLTVWGVRRRRVGQVPPEAPINAPP